MKIETTAGHPALDLANHAERLRDAPETDAHRLVLELARATGDLDDRTAREQARLARREPEALGTLARRTRALADALRTLLHAHVDGRRAPAEALATIDREAAEARARERLAAAGRGYRWSWRPSDDADPLRALWPVAAASVALLASVELERVGRCHADGCAWLYLDATRNHSRRWCDMAISGNRAKARRFRERATS